MRRLINYRKLSIANYLLPAIVNDGYTGLEDGDIDQLSAFLHDLSSEVNIFCESLTPDEFFYDIVIGDAREAGFRGCDVTKLDALCSPVTVLITTHGGEAPDANLYGYTSSPN